MLVEMSLMSSVGCWFIIKIVEKGAVLVGSLVNYLVG